MILTTSVRPLIIENKHRSDGYRTAAENTSDERLKRLFNRLSDQSRHFAREVNRFPAEKGMNYPVSRVTNWQQIKSVANDRNSLLSCCENCENALLKRYDETLIDTEEMPSIFQEIIITQRNALKKACDEIKSLRNNNI